MLKRFSGIATALCSLTLGLLSLPSAQAAAAPVLVGQSDNDPSVIGWVDTSQGSGIDKTLGQQFHDLFAGSTWTLMNNQTLIVTGHDGKTIMQLLYLANSQMTFTTFHTSNGKTTINGDLWKDSSDSSKGYAEFWVTTPSQDGQTIASPRVFLALTFANNGGSGSNTGLGPF